MLPPRTGPRLPRSLHIALFAIGLLWVLAARTGAQSAAEGISRALHADLLRPLLNAIFLLVLLPTGFTALNWVATRNGSLRSTNALPVRSSAWREWQKGAALGWTLVLFSVLPLALAGVLHPQFWTAPRAWALLVLSLTTLLFSSLAIELAFRGFLFRSLIAATGPATATLILSLIYAFAATSSLGTAPFSFTVALLLGVLFSFAYLRTHALWFGWGLRFGWLASMGVLFGLPLAGSVDFASVIATGSSGPAWFSGGLYGPEGALLTVPVVLAGIVALYRLTRNYAWQYTHPPIVPAGYPMDVPPPAAHAAMEASAAPLPLVQILGTTSTHPSTEPVITRSILTGRDEGENSSSISEGISNSGENDS